MEAAFHGTADLFNLPSLSTLTVSATTLPAADSMDTSSPVIFLPQTKPVVVLAGKQARSSSPISPSSDSADTKCGPRLLKRPRGLERGEGVVPLSLRAVSPLSSVSLPQHTSTSAHISQSHVDGAAARHVTPGVASTTAWIDCVEHDIAPLAVTVPSSSISILASQPLPQRVRPLRQRSVRPAGRDEVDTDM